MKSEFPDRKAVGLDVSTANSKHHSRSFIFTDKQKTNNTVDFSYFKV